MALNLMYYLLIICKTTVLCEIISRTYQASENVCFEVYGSPIRDTTIRSKTACVVACSNSVSICRSYLYKASTGHCWLNSDIFVGRTNLGCTTPVIYGELLTPTTTTLSSMTTTQATVTCIDGCTNSVNGYRLCDGGGPGVCDVTQGRIEVFYNHSWGTVCDDYWSVSSSYAAPNSNVACRIFGFSTGITKPNSFYGGGTGEIWLDNVYCAGTEDYIADCTHNGWGVHNCNHDTDQGVLCS